MPIDSIQVRLASWFTDNLSSLIFSISKWEKRKAGGEREEVEKNKEKRREEEREERRMKEKREGRKEGGNGQADRGEHPFQTSYRSSGHIM